VIKSGFVKAQALIRKCENRALLSSAITATDAHMQDGAKHSMILADIVPGDGAVARPFIACALRTHSK
jgi:hypothetical protein